MQPKNILKLSLITVIALMCVPVFLQVSNLKLAKPLGGYIHVEPDAGWNKSQWFEGVYQDQKEKYLNQNFGLRNTFVRLHNQIEYCIFNELNAKGVVIGKEEFLYESLYIESALGMNYIGRDSIEKQIIKWTQLKKDLEEKGKKLLIMIAPGKAGIYPEYIPDTYKKADNPTNYDVYLEFFKERGFEVYDVHNWFRTIKGKTKFPLYGKATIHWSNYGQYLVADSLLKRVSALTDKKMPEIVVDQMELVDDNIEAKDYEIGHGLNLFTTISTYPTAKVEFHLDNSAIDEPTPKVTFVSDSYYWGMYNFGFSDNAFGNGQFWYYNEQIFPDSYNGQDVKPSTDKARRMVAENDVVVIQCTEASMYRFGFGFIDMYLDDTITDETIQGWMEVLRQDSAVYQDVVKKANDNQVSIEKQLRDDAIWMAKHSN